MKLFFALALSVSLLGSGCASAQDPSSQELNLSGRGLTTIPSTVFSRTELKRLDLSNNQLTGAPQAEIRYLKQLTSLNLSGNKLTGLPAELGQLHELEMLDLANNNLTGLPLEIGDLVRLRVLDVSGNPYSKQDLEYILIKLPTTEIRK